MAYTVTNAKYLGFHWRFLLIRNIPRLPFVAYKQKTLFVQIGWQRAAMTPSASNALSY
jgi:hypothetical protein